MASSQHNSTKIGFILAAFLIGSLFFGMCASAAVNASISENNATQSMSGNPAVLASDSANIPELHDEDILGAGIPANMAPMNPDLLKYLQNQQEMQKIQATHLATAETTSDQSHALGYVPPPVSMSHLKGPFIVQDTGSTAQYSISAPTTEAAPSYDLRTTGKVTPVKNQLTSGTCWAFATYGALESFLRPGETWDFSENNMKNLLSTNYSEGYDRGSEQAGSYWKSTAYLARWSGPISEADDPFNPSSSASPTDKPVRKHVQNVYFIPDRKNSTDNTNIKTAIQTYGGVGTTIRWEGSSSYWNETSSSYHYMGSNILNHAVTIVGWDDTYDKSKFSTVPPGNGAFIVKNSWGSGWGESGYFYISYNDTKVGKDNVIFTAESPTNYNHIYQYDPLGWTAAYYFGGSKKSGWIANVFTSTRTETLSAVSFYTTDTNTAYQVYVYKNPNSGPVLNSSGAAWSGSGTFGNAGYHTVTVSPGVSLKPGDKFSVVVKLTNPSYDYYAAVESPNYGGASKANASAGQSYYSTTGAAWTDLTTILIKTNACIKAFTNDTGNGAGADQIGVVRDNKTWLLDASGNGVYGAGDRTYTFGTAGDRYVTGDWNGNGTTKIGVVRNNKTWLLDASGNGAYGAGDRTYTFGLAGDVPVTGDWTGNGTTRIGVVRNNKTWILDVSGNGAYGAGDLTYTFGTAGDVFITGDWNNDHTTEIGVVRNNKTWLLDASGNGAFGAGDLTYTFGLAGDRYVTGDWADTGTTRIGVVRTNTTWLLDASGDGKWGPGDYQYTFGKAGDKYVTGKWS